MSKYIVDKINGICIIEPGDVHMAMNTVYGDKYAYFDRRLITSKEVVIYGKTIDNEDFFIKIPVDPHNNTIMCIGDAAISEINEYNDKWYTGTSQIRL